MKILILGLTLVFSHALWAQTGPKQCDIVTPLNPPTTTTLKAKDTTGEFNCGCTSGGAGSCALTISAGVMFCTGTCRCGFTVVIDSADRLQQ